MKTTPLVRSNILGLFGDTFTADHMDSRQGWEKLWQNVRTLLCQKHRTFSQTFMDYLESTQNFAQSEKKKLSLIA